MVSQFRSTDLHNATFAGRSLELAVGHFSQLSPTNVSKRHSLRMKYERARVISKNTIVLLTGRCPLCLIIALSHVARPGVCHGARRFSSETESMKTKPFSFARNSRHARS